jgi:hypothetical protein
VCKSQYLKEKQLKFLADNWKSIVDKETMTRVQNLGGSNGKGISQRKERVRVCCLVALSSS